MKIKKFDKFVNENYMISEKVSLTQGEKDFLWAKMEVKKKAKAKETESDVYKTLQGSKSIDSTEEFIKILNSLEYSMKKKVKSGEAPKGKYTDAFNSLKSKLPSEWVGVQFSSLKAKDKRDSKKPTEKSLKKDIISWLDKKGVDYDSSLSKKELLKKVK